MDMDNITPAVTTADAAPILESMIEEIIETNEPTKQELKMMAFMEDPERHTKIFLSSFFRDKGLIWWASYQPSPSKCSHYTFLQERAALPRRTAHRQLLDQLLRPDRDHPRA